MQLLTRNNLQLAAYGLFIVVVMLLPLFMDVFWLNRMSKYLVFGMLGIAISMSWGYAGILNLGQGLFFGFGAYMLAMSLKLASPTSLQQGSADEPVPDFMLWTSEPGAPIDLCCINQGSFLWIPFKEQWFGVAMGLVMPTLIAFVLGYAMFRARIAGVYVAILTLALCLLVRLLVIDAQPLINGFNGLTDLGWFTVGGLEFDPYLVETYYLIAVITCLVLIGARWLVNTKVGVVLQAIRDNEERVRYLGYDVAIYKVFFFCISAAIAGLAGMLYVIAAEFASPTYMNIGFSISMVVWAAVGGRWSLLGACIGAILLNVVEATVSETEMLVEAWQLIIGAIFLFVVLVMPRGLAGFIQAVADLALARLHKAVTERRGR